MQAGKITTRSSHAFYRTGFIAAFGAVSALVLAGCADSPTGPRSPASSSGVSKSVTSSAATTLGRAARFAALGASTVTCTVGGSNNGDVGVSPGTSITGFNPDCTLTGALHSADDAAAAGQADAAHAYGALSAEPCDQTFGAVQELAGLTLHPGVYCFPTSAQITGGTLTLSGAGPYVFKVGTTFITFTGSSMVLSDGATCDQVFWLVGSSSTLGGPVTGNIIAYTSIGLDPYATLAGRALALNAAVTMSGSNVISACS